MKRKYTKEEYELRKVAKKFQDKAKEAIVEKVIDNGYKRKTS